ncbi:MAG: 4Fe-4S binding protein [Proteobacteria bacterium]|nr:4Fe-4S binding protein [Pseudomonadota bacterium]MBU1740617.1 4Fe-4S binding protein [Pseudomonadota bacterium]
MTDDVYARLRQYLDQFPLGFPRTASGVEIEILKQLFTPAQAETALLVSPFLETAGQIAARAGRDEPELEAELEAMADAGLLFRVRRGPETLFRTAPFMIGLYEYSVQRMDAELARLCKEYYDTAYQTEMGASDVPGFKVVPIGRNVAADLVLLPYMELEKDIRAARRIAVAPCVCRKEARLTGTGCDHPLETCLSFGAAAEFYIDSGLGREISAAEAIGIVHQADEAGLVHAGANAKHLSNICNCCPCCCASMKGIVDHGHDKRKYMNALFEAVIGEADCVGCGDCQDRCPVGAVAVDEIAEVDPDRCLGCGLCAGACPSEAIVMRLRPDRGEPFERTMDLAMAILEGKRKNAGARG